MKACPKRIPCHLCTKTFLKAAYLRKHLQDTHRNITETALAPTEQEQEQVTTEEDWDKDPGIEVDYHDSELDEEEGKDADESESCSETDGLLEGRIFRKPTVPQLPAQKKRPAATSESSFETDLLLEGRIFRKPTVPQLPVQKKILAATATSGCTKRKRVTITYVGDMKLNLGSLVRGGKSILASDVDIELVDGKLKVDVLYSEERYCLLSVLASCYS